MPTESYAVYYTRYQERSDYSFDWTAEQGTDMHGLRCHDLKRQHGVFPAVGLECVPDPHPAFRMYPRLPPEGPHNNMVPAIFRVPLAAGTVVSDARFIFQFSEFTATIPNHRIYGVASDDYIERFHTPDYSATYHAENLGAMHPPIHPVTGKATFPARKYVADASNLDQEHTDAQVLWLDVLGGNPGAVNVDYVSPDISSIINEIIGRKPKNGSKGWQWNNRLCLVVQPYAPQIIAEYGWDPQDSTGYGAVTNRLARIRLQVTY